MIEKICPRCKKAFVPLPGDECFLTCTNCRIYDDVKYHRPPKYGNLSKHNADWQTGGNSWDDLTRAREN